MPDKKHFKGFLKASDTPGTGTAVFATLNKVDLDGDVTLPGAFGDGQTAKLQPAHDWKAPNMGFAKIRESGNDVIADFSFYLEMQSAKDWHESMKQNFAHGVPQEFSYGFDVVDREFGTFEGKSVRFLKKMRVFEVSPVLLGAGINTRLTDIKSADGEKAVRGSWESTQEALRSAAIAVLVPEGRDGYAYIVGTFSNTVIVNVYFYDGDHEDLYYEFDWSIGSDGNPVLSNQREVMLETVVRLKNLKFADHVARVLGDNHSLIVRSKAHAALRMKEGRTLSQASRDRLTSHLDQLNNIRTDLEGLLAETAPVVADDSKAIESLFLQFLETDARVQSLLR